MRYPSGAHSEAVDDKLCSNHAHHRDDLREELDNVYTASHSRVTNAAPPNELCNSPGGSGEPTSPVAITPPPSGRPCKGTKRTGKDCGAPAMKGKDYCRHHQDQGVTGAKTDQKEESGHVVSTLPIESTAVEPSTVDGGSILPS